MIELCYKGFDLPDGQSHALSRRHGTSTYRWPSAGAKGGKDGRQLVTRPHSGSFPAKRCCPSIWDPGQHSSAKHDKRHMTETRIDKRFAALKDEGRAALVSFISAGDPDLETCRQILAGLPAAGADVIELGMPFSDPMADGPAIQASSLRALKAGHSVRKTLELVADFRKQDAETPIVLMGYYNPIYVYPGEAFLDDAKAAGVDGLIVVDVPPEADDEICLPAIERGLSFIRLATPTTDAGRLPAVLANTSGFVYYVSITGITGAAAPVVDDVHAQVARIKASTKLPVAVGFGVRTAEQAKALAKGADGVVVGSALINAIAQSLDDKGGATAQTVPAVLNLVKDLSAALRS